MKRPPAGFTSGRKWSAHRDGKQGTKMAPRELANRVHRIKITVDGTRPQVWRRVEVPSVTRLNDLHMLIQVVMGWKDVHLHAFEFAGRRYSENEDFGFGPPDLDEHEARVGDVLRRKNSTGAYIYDFGDDWFHTLTVEGIVDAEPHAVYPRLLDGHGGCPPEDCGGVPGFEYLRHLRDHPEEITGGFHGDVEEQRSWVELLEPDSLDLEKERRHLREAFGTLPLEEEPAPPGEAPTPARPVSLPPEEELARAAEETAPLRDLLRLARWFGPSRKLTGTRVPRPADVRAVVEELDLLPPASEEEAAERAEKLKRLRAARDLPGFLTLWNLAVDLELIEITSGQARPATEVTEGLAPTKTLELWAELFEDTVDNDPAGGEMFGAGLRESELLPPVLRMLYEAPDDTEFSLEDLVEVLIDQLALAETTEPDKLAMLRGYFTVALYRVMHRLAGTGGVHLVDNTATQISEEYRGDHFMTRLLLGAGSELPQLGTDTDCLVTLPPLGRYGVRQILLGEGIPAPLSGHLAEAGAAELLDALAVTPPESHLAEIAPWLAGRTASQAVGEIAEAASEPTGTGAVRRAVSTTVLHEVGEQALPELRALLGSDRPTVAGLAAGALLASGALPEEEHAQLLAEYGPWLAIDMVAGPLELGGEEHLSLLLALNTDEGTGPIGQLLIDGADQLWKTDHPATVPALETLGRLHPDKKVAKAARRAAHKARSRG